LVGGGGGGAGAKHVWKGMPGGGGRGALAQDLSTISIAVMQSRDFPGAKNPHIYCTYILYPSPGGGIRGSDIRKACKN
jgi:hypothetical protein